MKYFIILIGFVFVGLPLYSQQGITFEQAGWEQVMQKAKTEGKLIFIDILAADCTECDQVLTKADATSQVSDLYNANFINYRVLPQHDKYLYFVTYYNIKSFPAYLYIQPNGTLTHISSGSLTVDVFVTNAQTAIKYKNEPKPIAQWNLEYENQKTDKRFVYDYIEKRTALGLDNADIIDQYATIVSNNELMKASAITLLLERNRAMNANGTFFGLVINNQDKVKSTLHLKDSQFNQILLNSIEYTFNKACKAQSEPLLDAAITAKLAYTRPASHEDSTIIQNEYRTKFYYNTKQPLLMANFVVVYANTIMTQEMKKEERKEPSAAPTNQVNQKALFPSALPQAKPKPLQTAEQIDITYSFKLRDAAQYVVEMLSNKTMLNNALLWSQKAIELFDNFSNYETHAYVLYKLGKRGEAIASMEKAYAVAPTSDENGLVREKVEAKLIKMKRGERIW